jgi:ABC-type transport system involved in multi-copper enzyme maturation permease subunit
MEIWNLLWQVPLVLGFYGLIYVVLPLAAIYAIVRVIKIALSMGNATINLNKEESDGLKALLVWAELYFITTGNTKNDDILNKLNKKIGYR